MIFFFDFLMRNTDSQEAEWVTEWHSLYSGSGLTSTVQHPFPRRSISTQMDDASTSYNREASGKDVCWYRKRQTANYFSESFVCLKSKCEMPFIFKESLLEWIFLAYSFLHRTPPQMILAIKGWFTQLFYKAIDTLMKVQNKHFNFFPK